MRVIGLTGGIGSGKSTVAAFFATLDVPIIDSDELAREAVLPGSSALEAIKHYFGSDILLKNGQLDRPKLRQQIFQQSSHRIWLENLLHPIIRQLMAQKISLLDAPYCLVEIPLLVGYKPNPLIQRVLLVDAPEAVQLKRIKNRDQLDSVSIKAIINAQPARADLLNAADDIIINDGSLAELKKQVLLFHQQYSK